MRLMGDWNWWAPGLLGRFADRLGFSHVEDDEDGRPGANRPPARATWAPAGPPGSAPPSPPTAIPVAAT